MRSIVRTAALVEAWFDTLAVEQRTTALALRAAVIGAEPALGLSVTWGNLVFSHAGAHALAIVCHRDHANLQVFNGAALQRDHHMLDGTGKHMRHLRCRYGQPVDPEVVAALARACVAALGP